MVHIGIHDWHIWPIVNPPLECKTHQHAGICKIKYANRNTRTRAQYTCRSRPHKMHLWTVYYKILNGLQFKLNIAAGNMHNHLLLGAFCVRVDRWKAVRSAWRRRGGLNSERVRVRGMGGVRQSLIHHVVDSLGNRNFVLLLIRNANTDGKSAFSNRSESVRRPSPIAIVIGFEVRVWARARLRMNDANEI